MSELYGKMIKDWQSDPHPILFTFRAHDPVIVTKRRDGDYVLSFQSSPGFGCVVDKHIVKEYVELEEFV